MIWKRTCQECLSQQVDKEPIGEMTDAYRNRKCKKCKSMALDYGSYKPENEEEARKLDASLYDEPNGSDFLP